MNQIRKKVGKLVVALFVFGTVALAAKPASAAWGYVCDVLHYPGTSSLGTGGYLSVELYSASNCSGSYIATYYLMTSGNLYPNNAYYSTEGLMASMRSLVDYATGGKELYISGSLSPTFVVNSIDYYSF